jgi:hypothetical protein
MEPIVEHKQWLHYITPVDQSAGNSNIVSIGQEMPAAAAAAAMVPIAQPSPATAAAAVTATAAVQPVIVAHVAAVEQSMTPLAQECFKGQKKCIHQNVFVCINEAAA